MKVKLAQYTLLPKGVHAVEVASVVETETKFGPAVKFVFRGIDTAADGVRVSAIASLPELGVGPRSKLYGWLKALGVDPPSQQEVDDGLVGRPGWVKLSNEKRDGLVFNKVDDVLAPAGERTSESLPRELDEPVPPPDDRPPARAECGPGTSEPRCRRG
jgi:hypothetical protein